MMVWVLFLIIQGKTVNSAIGTALVFKSKQACIKQKEADEKHLTKLLVGGEFELRCFETEVNK